MGQHRTKKGTGPFVHNTQMLSSIANIWLKMLSLTWICIELNWDWMADVDKSFRAVLSICHINRSSLIAGQHNLPAIQNKTFSVGDRSGERVWQGWADFSRVRATSNFFNVLRSTQGCNEEY
ncbi:hypothetical protein TNCV_1123121 [Trichonephila clavipes]|uniref:Uncharacterized protein n=1 Tax=Trichonephila clavipes TaxID=2585209 RepID=A0A8X6VFK1_TRICX|nr:hypothetical protein TNCV_1123121 [Trichonephila clavipes]